MSPQSKPTRSSIEHYDGLKWASFLSAAASLVGSWASVTYTDTALLYIVLLLTSTWAATCHLSASMIHGEVLKFSMPAFIFLILTVLSPAPTPLILGSIVGLLIYLVLVSYVTARPNLELIGGKRFYLLRHPLGRILPLAYLAPEPLSPIFEPIVAFYLKPGSFNIPVLQVSIFDPPAVHDYIKSNASRLHGESGTWYEAMISFRRAVGLLNLLDTLRKFEQIDLDGTALAASARLALSEIPLNARVILNEVLKTLKPEKRKLILRAFDIAPSPA